MVKWIIQKTLAGEKTLKDLICSIKKSGAYYELIELAPFSNNLEYNNKDDCFPIIYGSSTFMLLASNHDYLKDGVFFNQNTFLISEYIKNWGNNILNYDSIIVKAESIHNLNLNDDLEVFIRPNEDTKSITGTTMKVKELKERISKVIGLNPYITNNSEFVISTVKDIHKEWRNFIINKKVVSSCRYRLNGELSVDDKDIPDEMIEFCEGLCNIFTPHSIFVMDICEYNDKYFVIECNCFNGSGFYNNSLEKIVYEVNNFIEGINYSLQNGN